MENPLKYKGFITECIPYLDFESLIELQCVSKLHLETVRNSAPLLCERDGFPAVKKFYIWALMYSSKFVTRYTKTYFPSMIDEDEVPIEVIREAIQNDTFSMMFEKMVEDFHHLPSVIKWLRKQTPEDISLIAREVVKYEPNEKLEHLLKNLIAKECFDFIEPLWSPTYDKIGLLMYAIQSLNLRMFYSVYMSDEYFQYFEYVPDEWIIEKVDNNDELNILMNQHSKHLGMFLLISSLKDRRFELAKIIYPLIQFNQWDLKSNVLYTRSEFVIRWICENIPDMCWKFTLDTISKIKNCSFEFFQYMHEKSGDKITKSIIEELIENRNYHLVEYAISNENNIQHIDIGKCSYDVQEIGFLVLKAYFVKDYDIFENVMNNIKIGRMLTLEWILSRPDQDVKKIITSIMSENSVNPKIISYLLRVDYNSGAFTNGLPKHWSEIQEKKRECCGTVKCDLKFVGGGRVNNHQVVNHHITY